MLGRLLLLFTLVPLVEVYLLVTLGGLMGPAATIGLVFVTGALGAVLAKREGGRVLREWQEAVADGRVPEEGVLSSVLVLVGGVLLVTPGVLTDAVGLSLLIPPSRRAIAALVKRRLEHRLSIQTVDFTQMGTGVGFDAGFEGHTRGRGSHEPISRGRVIDVEAQFEPGPEDHA